MKGRVGCEVGGACGTSGEYAAERHRAVKEGVPRTSHHSARAPALPRPSPHPFPLPLPVALEFVPLYQHSCAPSVVLDTVARTVVAAHDLAPGDEVTFFYPSTEWRMAEPFPCWCGADQVPSTRAFGRQGRKRESWCRSRFPAGPGRRTVHSASRRSRAPPTCPWRRSAGTTSTRTSARWPSPVFSSSLCLDRPRILSAGPAGCVSCPTFFFRSCAGYASCPLFSPMSLHHPRPHLSKAAMFVNSARL